MSSLGEERILEGETPQQYVDEHFARYRYAMQFVKETDTVGDFSCGTGYGTALLATKAKKVIGADISKEAIDFCKERHSAENIEYHQMDFDAQELPKTDFVSSFETIEHVSDPLGFIKKIRDTSKMLVFSVPMRCPSKFHKTVFNSLQDVVNLFKQAEMEIEIHSQKAYEWDCTIAEPDESKYYCVGIWRKPA